MEHIMDEEKKPTERIVPLKKKEVEVEKKETKVETEKVVKAATAKKVKPLNTFIGDVGLFELSKQIRKGSVGTNYIVLALVKPRSGHKNTLVFMANKEGDITISEPIESFVSTDPADALLQIGYKLV